MDNYNILMNNLEELNLRRFKENLDTYLDMIAGGTKTALALQSIHIIQIS